jgi:hypothetical protein
MATFDMQFRSRAALERAFATVAAYEPVEFCSVDYSKRRLRFSTLPGSVDPLLELLRRDQKRATLPPAHRR